MNFDHWSTDYKFFQLFQVIYHYTFQDFKFLGKTQVGNNKTISLITYETFFAFNVICISFQVQSLASMIVIELVWFTNFIIIALFPYMISMFGIHGSFYCFSIVGLANAIFSYFFVPETKGLSNAQIQDAFLSRKRN